MGFLSGASRPEVDRRQSLAGVPIWNEGVTLEEQENGWVLIRQRMRRGKGWFARFQPPVMERSIRLDELGSFVARLIDGQRNTSAIVAAFCKQYRVNRREALLSTVEFLKSLIKRGAVSILIR